MRRILCVLLILVGNAFANDAVWQPQKTWVFAVGVLNFDKQGLATWPDAGRQDAVMIDAYKKRGVPAEHIVFIKNQDATKANVVRSFKELLEKTHADDTLVFYYAGHGGRDVNDPKRAAWFVTYDTKNWVAMKDVFDMIEKHFSGSQVLLTADCCHSGSLAVEAPRRTSKIDYGVLTSAYATSSSTGNWTFTQCLIDMLNGNPLLDLNGDGKITFDEAAKYCENEMAFREGQLSCSASKGHFSSGLVIANASGKRTERAGECVEGLDGGKWWKCKILESKDAKSYVTWIGWEKKYDRWIDNKDLRACESKTYANGTKCDVEWDGKWYDATVVKNHLGLHLIHYEGYPAIDDEWVAYARIKPKK